MGIGGLQRETGMTRYSTGVTLLQYGCNVHELEHLTFVDIHVKSKITYFANKVKSM